MKSIHEEGKAYLAKHVSVNILKDLIETKFAETLSGVSEEGGGPALSELTDTRLLHSEAESLEDALILGWVDLDAALDQIKGDNSSVSDSTTEDAAKTTQRIIFGVSKLTAVFLWKKEKNFLETWHRFSETDSTINK
jgi:hypothetical protein